jgi:integrase
MLMRLPRRSEYVFPGEKDPTKARSDGLNAFWKVTRKKCNLAHVRLYDLRHSAGSYLAEAGVDPLRIAAQLNHKSLQTTKRYVHFSSEQLREIAEANARVIDGAEE